MSIEKVREELKKSGLEDRVIEFDSSSATVHLAAEILHCEDADICKTMSFFVKEEPIVVCMAGDKKVDNHKYKETFGVKAKMIPGDVLEESTGHEPGGCCPFALKENVKIYFDVSLKEHELLYPAAGTASSCVKLTLKELEAIVKFEKYVDIAK